MTLQWISAHCVVGENEAVHKSVKQPSKNKTIQIQNITKISRIACTKKVQYEDKTESRHMKDPILKLN